MALDSTLKRHDSLMPQPLGGLRKGTALALVVHVGLIVALAFGVAWRSQTPAGVSAELWAAVPQAAAPAPVETPKPVPTPKPPPQPVKAEPPPPVPQVNEAQIAIEKEKAERKLREQHEQQERERQQRARKEQERREQERERLEQEKAEQVAAQKRHEAEVRKQKEAEARQAQLRQDYLKRMMGQAGTGGQSAGGTAPRDAGPSASYAGRIIARVKPNIVLTDDIPGNPVAVVEVRCAPDGMIIGKRLVQSSGNKDWDNAVLRAIDRTEQLPRDTDGRVPSSIVIEFRPRD